MKVSEKILKQCKPAKGHVLVLKSIAANMKAYGGFQWPESGAVPAPDWKPTDECGNGLHGWLWGAGDASLRCKDYDAKWLVLSVPADSIVDLGSKVKFPSCEVVYIGDRETAVSAIQHYAPNSTAVMFITLTGGCGSTLTGGDHSTLTGGNRSTLTGGNRSTLTGGDGSVFIVKFYDFNLNTLVLRIAQVDGVKILPNIKYGLSKNLEFERVE